MGYPARPDGAGECTTERETKMPLGTPESMFTTGDLFLLVIIGALILGTLIGMALR